MEKLKPTYDLSSIKAEFSTIDGLRMTVSARTSAFALGLTLAGVVNLIQTITREHFYKSMTSYADIPYGRTSTGFRTKQSSSM